MRGAQPSTWIGRRRDPIFRAQPRLQGGEVDEQLECRARLPLRLRGAVELARGVAAAAEHGAHAAVRRHRDQRDLLGARRSAGFAERGLHRLFRGMLQLLIERRAHHQARLLGVGIEPALGDHPVGEIAAIGVCVRRPGPSRRGFGGARVRSSDRADLRHAVQHHRGAGLRELEIARRRVARRRPDQAGEHGCLGERQIARRLGEVPPRRGVDPVRAAAEVDPIEIDLEDLLLVEAGLDPERVERLLDLAQHAALGREEHELRQLLADRAAALDHAAGLDVAYERPADADRIDAGVLIKATVLDRDHRLGQPGRDLIEREVLAVAIAEAREGDAGPILQRDFGLPVVQGNAFEVGEVEAEVPPETDDQQEQPERA